MNCFVAPLVGFFFSRKAQMAKKGGTTLLSFYLRAVLSAALKEHSYNLVYNNKKSHLF